MFGHDHRRVQQFDVLNGFELIGRSQFQTCDFTFVDFTFDNFVNAFWR